MIKTLQEGACLLAIVLGATIVPIVLLFIWLFYFIKKPKPITIWHSDGHVERTNFRKKIWPNWVEHFGELWKMFKEI